MVRRAHGIHPRSGARTLGVALVFLSACQVQVVDVTGTALTVPAAADSGSGSDSDGLPNAQRRIFLTSTTTNGDLGGLAGADAICQARATAGGLTRTYKAILSTSTVNAIDRFSGAAEIYQVAAGGVATRVAVSADQFLNDQYLLDPAFQYDESGVDVVALEGANANFWLSTAPGGLGTGTDCLDYTSPLHGVWGAVGSTAPAEVMSGSMASPRCSFLRHLLCVSN